jgi:hypothetical protein
MKNLYSQLVFLFVLAAFSACKFPKIKQMQLNKDMAVVQEELKNPGNFSGVGITNNTNNSNGIVINSITVTLTNGKDLPADLNEFAKEKAKLLADAIINKGDYASIEVIIKSESSNGIVSTSTSRTFDFSFEDLKPAEPEKADSLHADSIISDSSSLQ